MTLWRKLLQKFPVINDIEQALKMKYPLTYIHHFLVRRFAKVCIHVIGDSHVMPFACKWPFIIHHCGAATAHNLVEKESTTNAWVKIANALLDIESNDCFIFIFGEIDARIHIYDKFIKTKESIGKLCMNTVHRYGGFVKDLESVNSAGFGIYILGIAPASMVEKNHFNYQNYGTPEQRRIISLTFNITLRNYCKKHNLKFIDLYPLTSDNEGFIKPEYNGDGIHLNSKIVPYVKEKILCK